MLQSLFRFRRVLIMTALHASTTASNAQTVTLPMRLVAGRPVVEVRLGPAGPFSMVFDTGAGATVLNADLVAEAGIPVEGNVMLGDPTGGAGTPGKTHHLPSLVVGGRTFLNVFAVSWNDSTMTKGLGGARGVLGAASLEGVVVEFDFPAMVVRLHTDHLAEGDGSIPYANPQSVIPSFMLKVGDKELEAHLDTGNGRGIGLPATMRNMIAFRGPTTQDTARSASASFAIETGTLAGNISFGGIRLDDPPIFLNERFATANIGTAALLKTVLTVDVGRRRVRIRQAP